MVLRIARCGSAGKRAGAWPTPGPRAWLPATPATRSAFIQAGRRARPRSASHGEHTDLDDERTRGPGTSAEPRRVTAAREKEGQDQEHERGEEDHVTERGMRVVFADAVLDAFLLIAPLSVRGTRSRGKAPVR